MSADERPLPHWHAYARTGPQDDRYLWASNRRDSRSDWLLTEPAGDIAETFEDEEQSAAWMRRELAHNPPRDPVDFHYVHAQTTTRRTLVTFPHMNAQASYTDRHGRWVFRILVPRPRPVIPGWPVLPPPCPQGQQ